jgi:three-Cys-motif partner protein
MEVECVMGKLVDGDDGLPAAAVGEWAEEKIFDVMEYVKLSHGARRRFLGWSGATYIDLFCGPGQSKIRDSRRFVDGAAVAAWKVSKQCGSPFSAVYIADVDEEKRDVCAARLRKMGAPVVEMKGTAAEAAQALITRLNTGALHFAFLDPYSLGSLSFKMLRSLAAHPTIDILVHISAMDLARNIEQQTLEESADFDSFAPGWSKEVPINLPQAERRQLVMDYWAKYVESNLALNAKSAMHPVKNSRNALMYWLLLLYRHDLAGKFWNIVLNARPQSTGDLFRS